MKCNNLSFGQQFNHNYVSSVETQSKNKYTSYAQPAVLLASLAGLAACTAVAVKYHKNAPIRELRANYQKIITSFPEDKNYYETLAKGINLKSGEEYKLASITGPQQLKSILKNATSEDFRLGKNLEGVKNRTLRINLHNHTTASDGHMSPKEIIDQSAKWADEVKNVKGSDGKPFFVLAITDHDTLNGAKEAVRIVSENPEKYKNLNLVLGAEISVSHTNPKDVKRPMNFELIGYALNPFNEKMNNFLANVKKSRMKSAETFTQKVREKFPEYDFNQGDTEVFHRNLKNMRTNGVLYLQEEYLNHKIMFTDYVKDINEKIIPDGAKKINPTELFQSAKDDFYNLKDTKGMKNVIPNYYRDYVLAPFLEERGFLYDGNRQIFNKIFEKDFSDEKKIISEIKKELLPKIDSPSGYIVRPKEIFDIAKDSKEQGFFGVAHPGLITADMFSDDVSRVCNECHYDKGEHLAWRLYKHLKTVGGDYFKATETNYQSYPYNDAGAIHWRKYMGENKANEFGLLKTGGIDCHKTSIFKKHTLLSKEEINNNNLSNIVNC